jgi:hypothetical protein
VLSLLCEGQEWTLYGQGEADCVVEIPNSLVLAVDDEKAYEEFVMVVTDKPRGTAGAGVVCEFSLHTISQMWPQSSHPWLQAQIAKGAQVHQ